MLTFIKHKITEFYPVVKRFPVPVFMALVSTILITIIIGQNDVNRTLLKLIFAAGLGISLGTAAHLYAESRSDKPILKLVLPVIAIVLTVAFYILIINVDVDYMGFGIKYMVLHLMGILLVSVAAYYNRYGVDSFAKFNSEMFLHLIESIFASLILYGALAMAMLALDKLFGVNIKGDYYFKLMVWIAGIFNTLYIFSGIDKDLSMSSFSVRGNRFYRILTQYILIPVTLIYMVILYAYGIKTLLGGGLTESWVSVLTLWFFVVGIFTYLMNYQYREHGSPLSKTYLRWFFPISLPLIALLLWISYKNIAQIGVLPTNYYTALLTVWILGVAIYMIASKKDDIRWISVSLLVVGLFSLVGPWSFENVSINSQYNRITKIFHENNLIIDGKLLEKGKPIEVDNEFYSSIYQLEGLNGLDLFVKNGLVSDSLVSADLISYFKFNDRSDRLGTSWKSIHRETPLEYVTVSDYDYFIQNIYENTIVLPDGSSIARKPKSPIFIYTDKHGSKQEIDLNSHLMTMSDGNDPIEIEMDSVSMKIYVDYYEGKIEGDSLVAGYGSFQILIKNTN